jgi:hypothetical protein
MVLKWICEEWNGIMDWIDLAEDRSRWRAVVNAVMNFWGPQNEWNFLTNREPIRFSGRP